MREKKIASGILPVCYRTNRVLLGRRSPHRDVKDPNRWACFGGGFEEDQDNNLKETAIREFREETNFMESFIVSNSLFFKEEDNHLLFTYFLGIFDKEFEPDISLDVEFVEYEWFPIGEYPENLIGSLSEVLCKRHYDLMRICKYFDRSF